MTGSRHIELFLIDSRHIEVSVLASGDHDKELRSTQTTEIHERN